MQRRPSWTFRVSTHKRFIEELNKRFGTNIAYRPQRCSANYDYNTIVWMISFDRENSGFINEWVDRDTILQRCVRQDETYAGAPIRMPDQDYRLVVSIENYHGSKVYEIQGLFRVADGERDPMRIHFTRVADSVFEKHIPELFA